MLLDCLTEMTGSAGFSLSVFPEFLIASVSIGRKAVVDVEISTLPAIFLCVLSHIPHLFSYLYFFVFFEGVLIFFPARVL